MSPDPALLLARCTVTPSGALRLPWRIVLRPSDPKPRKINVVVVLRFRGLAKALRRHILTGTVPRSRRVLHARKAAGQRTQRSAARSH